MKRQHRHAHFFEDVYIDCLEKADERVGVTALLDEYNAVGGGVDRHPLTGRNKRADKLARLLGVNVSQPVNNYHRSPARCCNWLAPATGIPAPAAPLESVMK